MRHWMLKAMVQGMLSLLPGSHTWNSLLQRFVTKRLVLTPKRFERKILQCRKHLERSRAASGRPGSSFTVLELGTGWYPIIPIAMRLCGASIVWTVDIVSLLSPERLRQAIGFFVEYDRTGRLDELLPGVRRERVAELKTLLTTARESRSVSGTLERINVRPLVCDVHSANLDRGAVEFFISNCVLEHIPREEIISIFSTFRRLAAPSAVMSHLIDMSDHYADFDSSITPFNFLKYSERAWRWFNNRLHFQNRLRITDHRKIHEGAGFAILGEYNVQGSEAALDSVRLAGEFRDYPREDLRVTQGWLFSVPRGPDSNA